MKLLCGQQDVMSEQKCGLHCSIALADYDLIWHRAELLCELQAASAIMPALCAACSEWDALARFDKLTEHHPQLLLHCAASMIPLPTLLQHTCTETSHGWRTSPCCCTSESQ